MQRLQERAQSPRLTKFAECQRLAVVDQLKILESREGRLAERYRAEHARRLQWWWKALDKLQGKQGRERALLGARHAERFAAQRQADEAARTKPETGDLQDEKTPQWARTTDKEMSQAAALFAEYQAEQAAADAKTAGSDGASPSPITSPTPTAAAAVIHDANRLPISAVPPKTPDKPLTKQQLRQKEQAKKFLAKAKHGSLRH